MPTKMANAYQATGTYTSRPIHLRQLHEQLEDHDFQRLLPESTESIRVLAALNVDSRDRQSSLRALSECIKEHMADPNIHHIIMPIGPGHWRCMHLTKPEANNGEYRLELFDPAGGRGARAVEKDIKNLLSLAGLPVKGNKKLKKGLTEDPNLKQPIYSGPRHPQRDSYACGDFTAAYINQKVRDLSNGHACYDGHLLDTYETVGNKNHALRKTTRAISHRGAPQVTPELVERISLSRHEQKVLDKTLEQTTQSSQKYKAFLTTLLLSRYSIFESAEAAANTSPEKLSDEALAAQLQADEFKLAGLN